MNRKDSPESVIDSYHRRQKMTPFYIGGLSLLLVIAGGVILFLWMRGGGLAAAPTVTPTITATVAAPTTTNTPIPPTATLTLSPTVTLSPTITVTVTPSGPVEYKVQSGDNCYDLAVKNKVNPDVLLAINGYDPGTCPIIPGMTILIPLPNTTLPTETPIAFGPGQKYTYYVKTGETLAEIAATFHTTRELILKENPNVKDENTIKAGDSLTITSNTVTATPTKTPKAGAVATNTPTATKKP